jgi:hypothetical protein
MSEVATFQVFLDDFGDNGPPKPILPFIAFNTCTNSSK